MLNIRMEENGKSVVLHCAGRIVCGDETRLLCASLGQQGHNVALDLSEIETIDAAGIGALISLQAAGIYMQLLNPSKAVRELLRVTTLDSLFEIRSTSPTSNSEPQKEGPTPKRIIATLLPPALIPAT